MAPSRRFANYPGAKAAPAEALIYKPEENSNPVLRGWTLVIASAVVGYRTWIHRLLWQNAKFGRVALLPALDDTVLQRFTPNVIPLAGPGDVQLEIGPDLAVPQAPDLAGRFYSAADYHALYKSGAATPLQVVQALLPLIRRDGGGEMSKYALAWVHVHEDQVLAAARASTERWAAGKPLGVLDGVPFGVKDDIDVKGYVTTKGMKVNAAEPLFHKVVEETIWPVQQLEEAGGIMMGKMNQHELGMDTNGCNPSTGTPPNWYNTSYYPGGSSSGAGSALSAGLVPIAVGTDAGGSTRLPTTFCGVYALKTTHDRTIPMASSMCVTAPMAATVADLTIAYRVMARTNPDCPVSSLFAPSVPPAPSAKKYIGICEAWLNQAEPAVREVYEAVVEHLVAHAGYERVAIQIPYLREGQWAHGATCATESASQMRSWAADPARWLALFSRPNRIVMGIGSTTPAHDYICFAKLRQVLMAHLAYLFESFPGLLVLTPTTPLAGWPRHPATEDRFGFSDGNTLIQNMTYAWCANTSGCPAVSCPVGYVPASQGEGPLPVGIMAMGEWGAEEQLLAFAREAETYLNEVLPGGRRRPGGWADIMEIVKGEKDGEGAEN